jgi:hypothetical protein
MFCKNNDTHGCSEMKTAAAIPFLCLGETQRPMELRVAVVAADKVV